MTIGCSSSSLLQNDSGMDPVSWVSWINMETERQQNRRALLVRSMQHDLGILHRSSMSIKCLPRWSQLSRKEGKGPVKLLKLRLISSKTNKQWPVRNHWHQKQKPLHSRKHSPRYFHPERSLPRSSSPSLWTKFNGMVPLSLLLLIRNISACGVSSVPKIKVWMSARLTEVLQTTKLGWQCAYEAIVSKG